MRLCLVASLSLLAAVACGSSAPEPAVPEAAASAAPTDKPPPMSASEAPQAPTVSASVISAAVSSKADHFTRATISFKNSGTKPCRVKQYTLHWAGGTKTITVDNFTLLPNADDTRAIKVHAEDGDVSKLTGSAGTSVDVDAACP
jgi:hypothetical protein